MDGDKIKRINIELNIIRGLNTEVAMRRAMYNVEKHYAVVGVLEEFNKTLIVLEHFLPTFFKGALDLYRRKCFYHYITPT